MASLLCVLGLLDVQVLDVLPLLALVDRVEQVVGEAVHGPLEEEGAHAQGGEVARGALEEYIVDLTAQSHL